jgi:serine/threonine protein kinase
LKIFSLVTIITIAELKPPYAEMPPMQAIMKIVNNDPPKLSKSDSYSNNISDFIAACLQKDASKRMKAVDLIQVNFSASTSLYMKMRICVSKTKSL